ncbi:MAG: DNA replication complex GINS family protein [Candidatus Heimdallarchaeota archaeon]|nr:DNA replication complex GINS family protein [Candidatus Heimdallarchaeota archaeon]
MSSDESILTELERIQFDFENKDISVKCLKNLEEFDMGDRKFKLLKGSRLKVPFWLAIFLEEDEYVELEETNEVDFPSLHKLAIKEGENISLQQLNAYFYIAMRKTYQEFKDKKKSIPYRQIEAMDMKLREIMTMRLSKIIKIAEKGKNITTKTRNFTPEERWLYEFVSEAIEKWKNIVKASDENII